MALGELLAVGPVEQRDVRVERRLLPHRLQDQHLLRGVGVVVGAAHDVGDAHVEVVHHDGEVVERRAVGAGDHEVVLERVLERRLAADDVLDDRGALVGHPQAHGPLALVLAAEAAVAVLLVPRLDLLAAGGRAVGAAVVDQLLDDLGVAIGPLGLEDRLLVVVELEPAQRVEDLLDVLGRRALAVGVLDPEQELPAVAAGEQPVVQCRPRTPDVQGACRGRCEADAHLDTVCHAVRASRFHAHRCTRLPRRRTRECGAARRGARLPLDPVLQPEPAGLEAACLLGRGGGRVPRGDRRLGRRRGADPRRLSPQLRLRGQGDPRQVADGADRGAAGGRRARRGRRRAAPRIGAEGRRAGRQGASPAPPRRSPRRWRSRRTARCTSRTRRAPAARSAAPSRSSRA